MLTDIFANRYSEVLWTDVRETDTRFLVQAFRIVAEQLYPCYLRDGKVNELAKLTWQGLNDRLSMELGLERLSSLVYPYATQWQGHTYNHVGSYPLVDVCRNFVLARYDSSVPPDRFMKERLSFIELAFRQRAEDLAKSRAEAEARLAAPQPVPRHGIRLPGDRAEGIRALLRQYDEKFQAAVTELNARLQQVGYNLHYHNGFFQLSADPLVRVQVEEPFWHLVSDPEWRNVDTDMKEAIDRRDNAGRDPAFYAARALESTLKIISDRRGLTTGNERGAHNFIDNLASARANAFIAAWEAGELKHLFTTVRNPLGHGPGSAEMPSLTPQQTDWSIGVCMTWIRSLIQRM